MEKQPNVKRSQKSSKKAPVKVVYISNPMKIKASPSEFRAVVQQLTGRYADYQPSHELPEIVKKDNHHQQKWQRCGPADAVHCPSRSDLSGRPEDEVMDDFIITPQMQLLDGYSPLFPSD